jgi:predicted lipid-binding transport protein (Tim44 family)
MIDRREHPLSTADLAGGMTARTADLREPQEAELRRAPQDRASEPEARGAGATVAARPMTEPPITTPAATTSLASNPSTANEDESPLFPAGEATGFRARWSEAQTGFVDEPRHAVEQADGLVAEMMQRLAQVFADERSKLEVQWSRGDDISTEDLRVALRRYRSFFDRLLAV